MNIFKKLKEKVLAHLQAKDVIRMDENAQTMTPTSKVVKQAPIEMTFADAMAEVTAGRRVRREEWPADEYGVLQDGWLSVFKNNVLNRWLVSDGDMLATDWMVIKETN